MILLKNKPIPGMSPVTTIPAKFYTDVDEVLSLLAVEGGHIERDGNLWNIVVDDVLAGTIPAHRFRPQIQDTNKTKINMGEGSWTRNGVRIVDTGGTTALGDTAHRFIVASLTLSDTSSDAGPSAITISADTSAPADSLWTTKRLLTTLTYDTGGNVSVTNRNTVGDIVDMACTRQDTAGAWAPGDTSVNIWEDLEYSDTAHAFRGKRRALSIVNGRVSLGKKDTGFTTIKALSAQTVVTGSAYSDTAYTFTNSRKTVYTAEVDTAANEPVFTAEACDT